MADELLKKSEENWFAAEDCQKKSRYESATSRFYYSVYQAARHWTDKNGHTAPDKEYDDEHAHIAHLVGNKAGGRGRDLRNLMRDLRTQRNIADYRHAPVRFGIDVQPLIDKAMNARMCFSGVIGGKLGTLLLYLTNCSRMFALNSRISQ